MPADDGDLVRRSARILLRPIASPLPLGFVGLAIATMLMSALQLEWLDPADGHQVALILIAFVVPLQASAAGVGFLARDIVVATAMGILAGTWLSVALVIWTSPAGAFSDSLGLFMLLAGAGMAMPVAAAATGKLVPALVLATTSVRLLTTGLAQITERRGWVDAAGVIGVVLGGLALYAATATALEDVTQQTVLPLGRRGAGATSLAGSFDEQLRRVEAEPGVREQL